MGKKAIPKRSKGHQHHHHRVGGLERKIVWTSAALLLVFLVFINGAWLATSRSALRTEFARLQFDQAESIAVHVETFLEEREYNLLHHLHNRDFTDLNRERILYSFIQHIIEDALIRDITLYDREGKGLLSLSREDVASSNDEAVLFARAIANAEPLSGDTLVTRTLANEGEPFGDATVGSDGVPTLTVAQAVKDHSGNVIGAVEETVFLEKLTEILSAHEVGLGGQAFIASEKGIVLASSPPGLAGSTVNPSSLVASLLGVEDVAPASRRERSTSGAAIFVTVTPVHEVGWGVSLAAPEAIVFAPLARWERISVLFSTLGLLLTFLIFRLLTQRLARTIETLHAGAMRFARGTFSQEIRVSSNDELQDLADAMNSMANSLAASQEQLEEKVRERTRALEEAQLVLAKEHEEIKSVLASIGDGAVTVDTTGRITSWNAMAEKILHFTLQDVLGRPYEEVLKPFRDDGQEIPKESRAIQRAITRGDTTRSSVRYRTKEGSMVPVRVSTAPVRKEKTGEIIGVVSVFQDLSRELELDKVKSEFITVTSHQLRTPLSSVKWSAEILLAGDLGPMNAAQREYVEQLLRATERLIGIVNDLLNVAQIEQGKVAIEPKLGNLGEVVDAVVAELLPLARPRNLTIHVEKKTPLPVHEIDPIRMTQVVRAIIFNAIMYSSRKGEVRVTVEAKKDTVLFTCVDQGVGIPKESQGRVFEKFFRASNVVTIEPSGSGVGLHLAKLIVEAHHGKIWFTSREGEGTTFYFTIPLPKEAKADSV